MKFVFAIACVLSLSACGVEIRARPDLKTSTLTLPESGGCVKGFRATPVSGPSSLGYSNAVEVSNVRCVATVR